MVQNLSFNFQVPISESAHVEGDFIINGTAINETITSNNHKFIAEELRPAAETLTGCPLLVDHENKVENIKGRVLKGMFNEQDRKIDFRAKVMDKTCQEMIKDGRLNSVSVGATVEDCEEAEGCLIPRGIKFKELSLVAVPADSNATFSIALKEAYQSNKTPITSQIVTSSSSSAEVSCESKETPVQETLVKEEPIAIVSQEILIEKMNAECKGCKYRMAKMPEDKKCPKCGGKMEDISDNKLENSIIMKGGQTMSEEIIAETAIKSDDSKLLLEKVEAMEKTIKEQAAKLVELSTPKKETIKNEFEESEDVGESYKIVQGYKEFSVVMNKY